MGRCIHITLLTQWSCYLIQSISYPSIHQYGMSMVSLICLDYSIRFSKRKFVWCLQWEEKHTIEEEYSRISLALIWGWSFSSPIRYRIWGFIRVKVTKHLIKPTSRIMNWDSNWKHNGKLIHMKQIEENLEWYLTNL